MLAGHTIVVDFATSATEFQLSLILNRAWMLNQVQRYRPLAFATWCSSVKVTGAMRLHSCLHVIPTGLWPWALMSTCLTDGMRDGNNSTVLGLHCSTAAVRSLFPSSPTSTLCLAVIHSHVNRLRAYECTGVYHADNLAFASGLT